MIIETMIISQNYPQRAFLVCNDARETGDIPKEIMQTDSMEKAVMLLKYIRGDHMTRREIREARQIIRDIDTKAQN